MRALAHCGPLLLHPKLSLKFKLKPDSASISHLFMTLITLCLLDRVIKKWLFTNAKIFASVREQENKSKN